MSNERILLATAPAVFERPRKVLVGHQLICVKTVEEAKEALNQVRFAGIILGVQFDESRMLDVLDYVRSDARHRTIPVVCLIGIKGRLSGAAIEALDQAARALKASAVIDIADFRDDEDGNRRLRCLIGEHIAAVDSG